MADENIKQVMQDAILDADSLEQFINGSDSETVLTRLSAEYPTLQKAIKQMFENGGLPATPFATKALMTASALVDGDYAMVTDETANNGLYVKTAGVWVKSEYDPLAQAKAYADNRVDSAFDLPQIVKLDAVSRNGGYVNNTNPQENILIDIGGTGRTHMKLDVSDARKLIVEGSTGRDIWQWVFADSSDIYISMSQSGVVNGTFDVPSNAAWAYRTYKLADLGFNESPDVKITKILKPKISYISQSIKDASLVDAKAYTESLLYSNKTEPVKYEVLDGFTAEDTISRPNFVSPNNGDYRKAIVIDATRYTSITVDESNAPTRWRWVFEHADGSKSIKADYVVLGKVEFAPDVVRAYRSIYYEKSGVIEDDTNTLVMTGTLRRYPLLPKIEAVEHDVDALERVIGNDMLNRDIYIPYDDGLKHLLDDGLRISPNEFDGATQTDRIKQAIAFTKIQGFGIVELGHDTKIDSDVWLITEAIIIPSNCWIYINNTKVKKADGLFDNMFRNEGVVVNPDPYGFALELNRNENMRVFGNDPKKSIIEGNRNMPKVAPHPINGGDPIPWLGDYYGWRNITMLFANSHDFRVYNLTFKDVTSWTILNEQGCSNYKYHDIVFDNNVKNGDGINNGMGCHDFEIYNLSGTTSDDMVAVHSLLNYIPSYPSAEFIYPKLVGGHAERGFGIKTYNGRIWNINAKRANAAGLVLWSGGGQVENISFSNIADLADAPFIYYTLRLGNIGNRYGAAPSMGDAKNITIRNVRSHALNNIIEIVSPLQDSWITNIKRLNSETTPIVYQDANGLIDNVQITNISNTP